ncbi:hypothetical protein Taro_012805 [Colocasia esculenta]|uniref:Uncharacterized protein n=1 Tax=Colocasia esculenta TaxID=4460 RepID=A0A843UK90_COLES|nr:hypothetical protein [Colocasia esculenta]
MVNESLRTQQFVRRLRPDLRQALIVACVTDLDTAYQTSVELEVDTLRTCRQTKVVHAQVIEAQLVNPELHRVLLLPNVELCDDGTVRFQDNLYVLAEESVRRAMLHEVMISPSPYNFI